MVGVCPSAPWPQGQLYLELSPLPPPSVSPNFELAPRAQPGRHPPWHLAWRKGWQILRPKAAEGGPSHSLQPLDRAAAEQAKGTLAAPPAPPPGKGLTFWCQTNQKGKW